MRDLMVFIDTQAKMSECSSAEAAEMRNGTVLTVSSPAPSPEPRESVRAAIKGKQRARHGD